MTTGELLLGVKQFISFKLPVFFLLSIITGALLFFPDSWHEFLSTNQFIQTWKTIISLVFIASITFFIYGVSEKAVIGLNKNRRAKRSEKEKRELKDKRILRNLENMSADEKAIIKAISDKAEKRLWISFNNDEIKTAVFQLQNFELIAGTGKQYQSHQEIGLMFNHEYVMELKPLYLDGFAEHVYNQACQFDIKINNHIQNPTR